MCFAGDALEAAWGDGVGCGLMAVLGADHFIGATPGRNQQLFNGTLFLLRHFILQVIQLGLCVSVVWFCAACCLFASMCKGNSGV